MRLPNVKMLLCWSSRMQIYGFVENHTFLEQFVSMGVPGHFSNLGVPGHFSNLGVPGHFPIWGYQDIFQSGGTRTFFQSGGTRTFFQSGGTRTFFFQSGGTSTIFSTLHGSLWLGKDKGSIMKSAESCGTIYYKHYYGNKLLE